MGSAFNNSIDLIQTGEPVNAGVANRPVGELDSNVRYLKSLIDAAEIGEALFARGVTVEAGAIIGMPVFYNPVTQQFERALAAMQYDPVTGLLIMAPSAQVWGLVYSKASATNADLLIQGYSALDLTNSVQGAVAAGAYYLSGTTVGTLVSQKPGISVPVLRADGAGNVLMMTVFRDLLESHTHYRFELTAYPAGDTAHPHPTQKHVITNPNILLKGWLPADHPSFNGHAPEFAAFGYNLSADPVLKNLWPPLPASSAYLEWNKGEHKEFGLQGVPLGVSGLAIIDRYGIWWLSDCYGDVPWPKTLNTSAESVGETSEESTGPECPRDLYMQILLWFNRQNFENDITTVTSLQSADSRIAVRCANDGSQASTGPLELSLNLQLQTGTNTDLGCLVFKNFSGQTFTQGAVLEGIVAGGSNVLLSSATTRHLVPTDSTTPVVYQGITTLSVVPSAFTELDVDLVNLNGSVTEEFLNGVYFLGLATGINSSIGGRIQIPDSLDLVTAFLALRFRILGRSAGNLPSLVLQYFKAIRPTNGFATPVNLPSSAMNVTATMPTIATIGANQYVEFTSNKFAVSAGDVVYYTLSRNAAISDGYSGMVGVLKQAGILSAS